MSVDRSRSEAGSAPKVPGYDLGNGIHRDELRRVYRATADDGSPVVITLHNDPIPSDGQLADHRHAFEVAGGLRDATGVVPHLALAPADHDLALVTAVVTGARLLRRRLNATTVTVSETCSLGASIATALAGVHDAGIVHCGLSPDSVLIDPSGGAHLLDFTHATDVESEHAPVVAVDDHVAEGWSALHYASPEQTGRVNRPVDARSDLYRLGVVLFEMLTGRPPFTDDSPRALIHAHIARQPARVDTLRPGTPQLLVELIDRLLAKNPERRYTTAAAVAADLTAIAAALDVGETPSFTLGARDVTGTLRLSDELVGRDDELAVLSDAYESAAAGGRRLVFVNGYSGVGKSRLVNELQRPVAAADGWFAAGKFDLYRRDLPYAAGVQAVGDLVHQVLTLPTGEITELTTRLTDELRGSAPALVELIPELSLLLGDQPPSVELAPGDALRRLEAGLSTLTRVLSTAEHPLLLFIDDLQWTDPASLDLLDLLIGDEECTHLMIVAAWRDNEVAPGHRAWSFVERHRDHAAVVDLEPLDLSHLTTWLARTLDEPDDPPPDEVAALAKSVFDKTLGNPFFARRLVLDLAVDSVLTLDADSARWQWDPETIDRHGVSENVGDLVARQLDRLDDDVERVLQIASCIGPEFDLDAIAAITADRDATIDRLHTAMLAGVLLPLDESCRYSFVDADTINPRYGFLHDRVQEAAHDAMVPAERAHVHLAVARQRIAAGEARDDGIVDVASHLGAGRDALVEPDERRRAAEIMVRAATRAIAVMATETAGTFLAHADELLADDRWDVAAGLARELHTQAADLAYIDGRFGEIDEHADAVLAHCDDPLQRMPIHNIRIGIGIAQSKWADATDYALAVLAAEYDVVLPSRPSLATVATDLARLRWELRNTPIERLRDLPPLTDPHVEAAMSLLMKTATNAYWASPNLVPLIGFTMVRQTVRHGTTGLSAYGYALYGLVLSSALFDATGGDQYGRLAMSTIDRTGARHLSGKTALIAHGFLRPGVEPMGACGHLVLDAHHEAQAAGDIENAAYCAMAAFYTAVVSGEPLDHIDDRFAPYVEAVDASGHAQTIYGTNVWVQVVANLRADTVQPELTGVHIDFEPELERLLTDEDGNAIPQGVCAAGFLAFLLDDQERAERHLGLLFTNMRNTPGQAYLMPCLGLYAVVLVRKRATGTATAADRAKLAAIVTILTRRAKTNEPDHRPFLEMIAAEKAAAAGRDEAVDRFLGAAATAASSGLTYVEGLTLERASEEYDRRGHHDLARHVLSRAVAVWRRYGATARLRLLGHDAAAEARVDAADAAIDVATLLDTAAAVSEEIEIDRVVGRVLELALENAGARRALLARTDGSGLIVQAIAELDDDGAVDVHRVAADDEPAWARIVGEYVVRTGQDLVIGDAVGDPLFERDPYVRDRRVQSVLCALLHRSGEPTGLLYLENDLGPNVFTERHLAVARTIAGQASISIENAALYERQREQARAFSRFVPRAFLERLHRDSIVDVELGDAVTADVTVLFSDLRDFTTLSERMSPADSFELLNDYLELMEPPIDANGGFIDKYIGDAVMALFADGADGALDAAIGMVRALERFNREHPDQPLRMGIGLHAGSVMLGTIGSPARMETTVIGDTVNTASRLEGLTKEYGAPVLVSSAVLDRLRDPGRFECREVGTVLPKGKHDPITIHEVLNA